MTTLPASSLRRRKGEDIWAFIERMATPEPNSGCLIWLGWATSDGYGRLSLGRRLFRVHRVAYEAVVGPIPPSMQVLHRCDVPSCVNPAHLFLGTNEDNIDDKVRKGRQSRLRGETNGVAKLSAADVAAIRELKGVMAQREIARRFGVRPTAICRIYNGKSWSQVDTKEPT